MPIIQNTQPVREKESLEQIVERLNKANVQAYNALNAATRLSFGTTWMGGEYTPEEIVGALCKKYSVTPEQLFEIHAKSQELLALLNPAYVPLVPPVKEQTPNEG